MGATAIDLYVFMFNCSGIRAVYGRRCSESMRRARMSSHAWLYCLRQIGCSTATPNTKPNEHAKNFKLIKLMFGGCFPNGIGCMGHGLRRSRPLSGVGCHCVPHFGVTKFTQTLFGITVRRKRQRTNANNNDNDGEIIEISLNKMCTQNEWYVPQLSEWESL